MEMMLLVLTFNLALSPLIIYQSVVYKHKKLLDRWLIIVGPFTWFMLLMFYILDKFFEIFSQ